MSKAAFHRLQTAQTLPMTGEIRDGNPAPQAGADQLRGELHFPHDEDLIEQWQGHPIEFLLLAAHHQLLAIEGSGAVGPEEIKSAHGCRGQCHQCSRGRTDWRGR
jgi:hypothetical protein